MSSSTAKMLVDRSGMLIQQYYDAVNDVYVAVATNAGVPSVSVGTYPLNATPVHASSGNVSNAIASCTLPGVAGKTNFLTGIDITAGGATSGSVVAASITGLQGGTRNYSFTVPSGVNLGALPLLLPFWPPLTASAPGVAIVVSLPALGIGNQSANVNSQGFTL